MFRFLCIHGDGVTGNRDLRSGFMKPVRGTTCACISCQNRHRRGIHLVEDLRPVYESRGTSDFVLYKHGQLDHGQDQDCRHRPR